MKFQFYVTFSFCRIFYFQTFQTVASNVKLLLFTISHRQIVPLLTTPWIFICLAGTVAILREFSFDTTIKCDQLASEQLQVKLLL